MYLVSRPPFWFYGCLFPWLTRRRYLQAFCRVLHTTVPQPPSPVRCSLGRRERREKGSTLTFMAFYLLVIHVTMRVLLVRWGKEDVSDFFVYGSAWEEGKGFPNINPFCLLLLSFRFVLFFCFVFVCLNARYSWGTQWEAIFPFPRFCIFLDRTCK